MTQNNDINSTNGAPKEYWEARAQNEKEHAKAIAFQRRVVKTILVVVGGLLLIWMVSILSICATI